MTSLRGSATHLRQGNRAVILEAMKAGDHVTIAELARQTGLSVATCTNIVPELVASGDALELPDRESKGGRPARRYAHNPDRILVALVILRTIRGAECIQYQVRNSAGSILARGGKQCPAIGPEQVDAFVGGLRRDFPALKAVALSIPGVVRNGVVGICDLSGLCGMPLEKRLEGAHGVAAVADNDMNFAAVGYAARHAEETADGLAFIVFPSDSCAGAGIVVNGRLVKGKSNFAGEVSFIPFGASREEQVRLHIDPDRGPEFAARIVASVAAVINPGVVVMTGDALGPGSMPAIRSLCREYLPAEHLPEIVHCPDYADHAIAGMAAAAMELADGAPRKP